MDLKTLAALLLAQLGTCANPFCGLTNSERFATHALPLPVTALDRVFDAVVAASGHLLLVVGHDVLPSDYERFLVVADEVQQSKVSPTFTLRSVVGEGLACAGDGCQYSVAGVYQHSWGALFVATSRGGSAHTTFVALPAGPALWLPFKGAKQRGLYVVEELEQTRALEVTPDGVRREWRFGPRTIVSPGWWTAQPLPDDSMALTSLDRTNSGAEGTLTFRLLRGTQGSESVEQVFSAEASDGKLTSAIGGNGEICIVVEALAGSLTGVIVDPTTGERHKIRLATSDDGAQSPLIAPISNGFVVAWVDSRREIRAQTILHGRAGLASVKVAFASATGGLVALTANGEEVTIVWQDGGHVSTRRLPVDVSAFEILRLVGDALCNVAGNATKARHAS